MQHAVVPPDSTPDRQPPPPSGGLEHHHIQLAINERCVGNQRDAGGQCAAVREENALHSSRMDAVLIKLIHRAKGLGVHERTSGPINVGDPSHVLLQGGVGIGDHGGVESDAGHHYKGVRFERAIGAADARLADVDRVIFAHKRCLDQRSRVAERQVEVASEEVAGAAREDRQRHAGSRDRFGHGAHGAIAACHEDHIRAGGERVGGDLLPEVFGSGLEEEGSAPPLGCRLSLEQRTQARLVDLDRVVDEGGDLHLRGSAGGH